MKTALIVYGGWDGHEPQQGAELFASLLREQDFMVEVRASLNVFMDTDLMPKIDLFVPVWTMGSISDEQLWPLLGAVKAGAGIAGWHGGMGDSFRTQTEYQYMVGGQWVAHPGNHIDYTVNITAPDDPIVHGIRDFQVHSEQYYMHVDPSNEVLATTTFTGEHDPWIDGTVMPVIWKRQYGSGRVFYSSLGHAVSEFDDIYVRATTLRGMLWASR